MIDYTNLTGNELIRYRIKGISIETEQNMLSKLHITNLDNNHYSYNLNINNILNNNIEYLNNIIGNHIYKYSIKRIRKEKLLKIKNIH